MASVFASMQAQEVRFGLKAGVNIANVHDTNLNPSSITSFHVGGIMEAQYSEKFALQPEIVFSLQGFDSETEGSKENYKFSYIAIPVMFKYFVVKGVVLEAGPQIGYLNTAKLERQNGESIEEIDIKDAIRDNDFGLNFGIGFQTKSGWSIGGRYNLGLTNLVRKELDRDFKSSILQISLGYLF